jgi:hypothetical protein
LSYYWHNYIVPQPRRHHDYADAGNIVRRPSARTAPGTGGHCTDGTRVLRGIVGSVAALTETGSLVVASGSGSQLPGYAGGAAHAIWIVGAQKVVPDLDTALRRVEEHALPLESARTEVAYGWPSAINRLLILNAEFQPGRGTVLLLREAIGF